MKQSPDTLQGQFQELARTGWTVSSQTFGQLTQALTSLFEGGVNAGFAGVGFVAGLLYLIFTGAGADQRA